MVESGTAIIAACLPTLRIVLSQSSIDKILGSVRSIFSLQSQSSHTRSSRTSDIRRQTSKGSSVDHIINMDGISSVESNAMKDIDRSKANVPQEKTIKVQNTLHQQESFA